MGPSGIQGVLADLGRLRAVAVEEHAGKPVVLFGHSMGALLSQAYAERHGEGLAGLALSGSPGAAEGFEAMVDMVQQAVDGGMADEPLSALAGFNADAASARTPFDWLSRDDAEVDAYIADPHCGENHPMITSMREHKGWLYLGGVSNNRIGRYRLPDADPTWCGQDSYWGNAR